MSNKKSFKRGLLFAIIALGLCFSYTNAGNFSIELLDFNSFNRFLQEGTTSIIPLKFSDNGNDFGGFMYFSDIINGNFNIDAGGDVYNCERQRNGWYYNAERGERLWPLDADTASKFDNIEFDGGIYTSCVKGSINGKTYDEAIGECAEDDTECRETVDSNYKLDEGYYGMVSTKFNDEYFRFAVGIEYQTGGIWIVPKNDSNLSSTFVNVRDIPVGFVYDRDGGIGLVGCSGDRAAINIILNKLGGGESLGSLFERSGDVLVWTDSTPISLTCDAPGSLGGSVLGVVIEGIVGFNKDKAGEYENVNDPKMQYFSSVSVNNATLLNYTKQKAEALCRGKWVSSITSSSSDVVCLRNPTDEDGVIDASLEKYKGKTLIVQGGDVLVRPVTGDFNGTGHYDIFVDKSQDGSRGGNLIIKEEEDARYVFTNAGFVNPGVSISDFNNGVQEAFDNQEMYTGTDVAVASLLKGNFIVNGNVVGDGNDGKLNNKYFIYGKFTSRDSYNDLRDVFTRSCDNTYGSDQYAGKPKPYCPASCSNIEGGCPSGIQHAYQKAPLVVIDQNYDSPLFW